MDAPRGRMMMLVLVLALAALAHAGGDATAQERPAGETVPVLPASIVLEKTVGMDSTNCAANTLLDVPPESVVYYCYKVTNTSGYVLPRHQLYDDDFPQEILPDNNGEGFLYDLAPGETIDTAQMGIVVSRLITQEITNFAIWESYVNDDLYAQDAARATVRVRNPQIAATVRVGAGDGCGGTTSFVGSAGTVYSLCVAIANSGQMTLTTHSLTIPALGINVTRNAVLPPGATLTWSRTESATLGGHTVASDLALSAQVTSTHTQKGVPFRAESTAPAYVYRQVGDNTHSWLPRVEGYTTVLDSSP